MFHHVSSTCQLRSTGAVSPKDLENQPQLDSIPGERQWHFPPSECVNALLASSEGDPSSWSLKVQSNLTSQNTKVQLKYVQIPYRYPKHLATVFVFLSGLSQTCKTEVTKFWWSRWCRWSRSCCRRLENPSGLWISFTPVSLAPSGRGSDFSELLWWGSATGGNSSILQHDLRDLLGKQLTVLIDSVWFCLNMNGHGLTATLQSSREPAAFCQADPAIVDSGKHGLLTACGV